MTASLAVRMRICMMEMSGKPIEGYEYFSQGKQYLWGEMEYLTSENYSYWSGLEWNRRMSNE
jgi:hypothetical protein